MDLLSVTLENVQAGVLIGNLCGVEGEPELESLSFGTYWSHSSALGSFGIDKY